MAVSVDLIDATVQLEQPLGNGSRTVATGFLISDPTLAGAPRVVLVTANHVLERMPGDTATIGFRAQSADGTWRYAPQTITIRRHGKPLWTHHARRDVAAIAIDAPDVFIKAAIPLNWLATDDTLKRDAFAPGDEMMTLGFPQGLSANAAGFPILRAGRVASYPLEPANAFPTFLLDFQVYPGNSGGPVYQTVTRPGAGKGHDTALITGMLTQQVQQGKEALGIGIVTQARFIRETVALLDATSPATPSGPGAAVAVAASTDADDAVAKVPR